MGAGTTHKWTFRSRFRKRAFGWRSQPAVKRVKEAVAEIKKVVCKDLILGAEGAVLFLEKVLPALEQVDSSSGGAGYGNGGASICHRGRVGGVALAGRGVRL